MGVVQNFSAKRVVARFEVSELFTPFVFTHDSIYVNFTNLPMNVCSRQVSNQQKTYHRSYLVRRGQFDNAEHFKHRTSYLYGCNYAELFQKNTCTRLIHSLLCSRHLLIYCYNLRGSCIWESMRRPFNDEKFINRRSSWVDQAPLAEVIHNYAVHTQRSRAGSKGNQTQRNYLT